MADANPASGARVTAMWHLVSAMHDIGVLKGLVGAMMDGKLWKVRRSLEGPGAMTPAAVLNSMGEGA